MRCPPCCGGPPGRARRSCGRTQGRDAPRGARVSMSKIAYCVYVLKLQREPVGVKEILTLRHGWQGSARAAAPGGSPRSRPNRLAELEKQAHRVVAGAGAAGARAAARGAWRQMRRCTDWLLSRPLPNIVRCGILRLASSSSKTRFRCARMPAFLTGSDGLDRFSRAPTPGSTPLAASRAASGRGRDRPQWRPAAGRAARAGLGQRPDPHLCRLARGAPQGVRPGLPRCRPVPHPQGGAARPHL